MGVSVPEFLKFEMSGTSNVIAKIKTDRGVVRTKSGKDILSCSGEKSVPTMGVNKAIESNPSGIGLTVGPGKSSPTKGWINEVKINEEFLGGRNVTWVMNPIIFIFNRENCIEISANNPRKRDEIP